MKKLILLWVTAALICGAQLTACSGSGESEPASSTSVTRRAADKAVKEIRAPLEKARAVKKQEEDRLNKMQENLNK